MRARVALFAVAFLGTAGCDPFGVLDGSADPPDHFSGQHIETDGATYRWTGDGFTITYEFKNPFDREVYMGGCTDGRGPAHRFQKRTRDGWETIYSRACLSIGGTVPTSIEPGETYTATFTVREETHSEWVDAVTGTYRVQEPMYWTWNGDKHREGTLKTEDWWSNEFEIH